MPSSDPSASAAALERLESWGAEHAAAAVVGPDGVRAIHGDATFASRWASVTKPVTAMATLIAVERGLLPLDEPAGPPGSTLRHLLAHTSGLPFEGAGTLARPGTRRIYSNPGFDAIGALVGGRVGMPFERVVGEWILDPLGLADTVLRGRPSEGLVGPLTDMVALAREWLRPTLLSQASFTAATTVAFPGLPGVVPGVGRFDPCDWGLGFELHDGKTPHWMGERNSPATYGHFGGSGTFAWVDPVADIALVALTDRPFGPWALEAWPAISDAVLEAVTG